MTYRLATLLLACLLAAPARAQEDLDGDWAGYIQATADAPSGSLTDFYFIIQIGSDQADFWANVQSDGDDIRAKIDGAQVSVDVITCDGGTDQALIAVKRSGAHSDAPVIQIYAGNAGASLPGDTDTYGRENAYPSSVRGFWPTGLGTDRTQYDNDMTPSGSPTEGGAAGPIQGSVATDLNGSSQGGLANASVPTAHPITILASGNGDLNTGTHTVGGLFHSASNNGMYMEWAGDISGDPVRAAIGVNNVFSTADSATGWSTGSFFRGCARFSSITSRDAAITGTFGTAQTTSRTPVNINGIYIGSFRGVSNWFNGKLSLVSLHTVALSNEWVAYDSAMVADSDQSDFYNGWTWTANATGAISPLTSSIPGISAVDPLRGSIP